MEVINDLLELNNLKIVQNKKWFNFSLDSLLLSNFANVNNKMKIIDICTGNCPIPLMLSTKTKAKIIAVEIQKEIYELGLKSIKINNLDRQIEIINKDIKEYYKEIKTDSFNLITCNPPYFKINNNSILNSNIQKTNARHEKYLNLDDLFKISKKILKNNGKIVLIHKSDRLSDIMIKMRNNNIEPKRIRFVYPKEDSKSNLVLIEGMKNASSGLIIEKPLIIHEKNGEYKKEILNMFKEV